MDDCPFLRPLNPPTRAAFPDRTVRSLQTAPRTELFGRSNPTRTRSNGSGYSARLRRDQCLASSLSSNLLPRDTMGPAVKFVVPVVTNGKVYVGTQKEVDVFGMINPANQAVPPTFNPPAGSYAGSISVTTRALRLPTLIFITRRTAPRLPPHPLLYAGTAIPLSVTTTLKAIAVATGLIQSRDSIAPTFLRRKRRLRISIPFPGSMCQRRWSR